MDANINSGTLTRPMDLLRSAWLLFKPHWKVFISIVIVPSILSLIGQLLAAAKNPALIAITVILAICSIVLSIVMQIALIDAVRKYSAGSDPGVSVKGVYKFGFSYFWPFILLAILQILVILGSGVLFIIPAIIVGVYVSMYLFALVIDDKRGFAALLESYSLVRGRWWPVVGRMLFFVVAILILYGISAGIAFILSLIFGFVPKSAGYNAVTLILNFILNLGVGPLASIYMYRLYESLKANRSSIDTGGFKKWLNAFIIIGIIAIILLPIIGGAAFIAKVKEWKSGNMPGPMNGTLIWGPGTDGYPYTDSTGRIMGNRPGGAGP